MGDIACERAVVRQEHRATDEGQLSIQVGEIIHVIERDESGWWGGYSERDPARRTGWFPGSQVEIIDDVMTPSPIPDANSPAHDAGDQLAAYGLDHGVSNASAGLQSSAPDRALQQHELQQQQQAPQQSPQQSPLQPLLTQGYPQQQQQQYQQQVQQGATEDDMTPRPPALRTVLTPNGRADIHALPTERSVWRQDSQGSTGRGAGGIRGRQADLLRGEGRQALDQSSGSGAFHGPLHRIASAPRDQHSAPRGCRAFAQTPPHGRLQGASGGGIGGAARSSPWQFGEARSDAAQRINPAAVLAPRNPSNGRVLLGPPAAVGQLHTPCWGQTQTPPDSSSPPRGTRQRAAVQPCVPSSSAASMHGATTPVPPIATSPEALDVDPNALSPSSLIAALNASAATTANLLTEAKAAELCQILSEMHQLSSSELRESQSRVTALEASVHKERACKAAFEEAARTEAAERGAALREVAALRRQLERERQESAAEKDQLRRRCEELTAHTSGQTEALERAQQRYRDQDKELQELRATATVWQGKHAKACGSDTAITLEGEQRARFAPDTTAGPRRMVSAPLTTDHASSASNQGVGMIRKLSKPRVSSDVTTHPAATTPPAPRGASATPGAAAALRASTCRGENPEATLPAAPGASAPGAAAAPGASAPQGENPQSTFPAFHSASAPGAAAAPGASAFRSERPQRAGLGADSIVACDTPALAVGACCLSPTASASAPACRTSASCAVGIGSSVATGTGQGGAKGPVRAPAAAASSLATPPRPRPKVIRLDLVGSTEGPSPDAAAPRQPGTDSILPPRAGAESPAVPYSWSPPTQFYNPYSQDSAASLDQACSAVSLVSLDQPCSSTGQSPPRQTLRRSPRGQHSPRGRREETPPSGNVRAKVSIFERRCSSDTPTKNRVPSSLKRGASGAPVATPFGTGGRQRRTGRSLSELPSGAAATSAEAPARGQGRSSRMRERPPANA